MVLYVIGLGLGDEKDITVRGLEAVKSCKRLYLEFYTSILGIDNAKLEAFYGVPVILADRTMVESEADSIYLAAKEENIGFLVVGDPLCATTHTDLIIRARDLNIPVEIIHNTSVMGASASCGLQLYQFGYCVSIPLFEGTWRPDSFYNRIVYNKEGGMHTLALLDIKVKEPDYATHRGGKLKYLPPRFMTVNTAIEQLLEAEDKEGNQKGICRPEDFAVGMARLGQPDQLIVYGTLAQLRTVNFGKPLHCMALVGEVHPLEQELLDYFKVKDIQLNTYDVSEDGCPFDPIDKVEAEAEEATVFN
jgi:diphthine methyl ester synthase